MTTSFTPLRLLEPAASSLIEPTPAPAVGSSLAARTRLKFGPLAGRGVLVHEWISPLGGSEKVLAAMTQLFPATDLLCLWNDTPGGATDAGAGSARSAGSSGGFAGRPVTETALARTALRRSKAAALPAMPLAWRRQPGPAYDWALVSSHLFAHHVSFANATPAFRKYVYVHTPARYIWTPELDGRGQSRAARTVAAPLRRLDRRRAGEAHSLAANSHFIRQRIADCWDREATVVYPPVDVDRIAAESNWAGRCSPAEREVLARLPQDFLLGASRLVSYKALDAVIDTAAASGLPAVIAGGGPDRERLESVAASAGVPVFFLGRVSDELLFALYQQALAYVFPAIEDFGIMPVEAMAAGARVIGPRVGGVAESVVPGLTGELIDFRSPAEAQAAVAAVDRMDRRDSVERAWAFDRVTFHRKLTRWLRDAAGDR